MIYVIAQIIIMIMVLIGPSFSALNGEKTGISFVLGSVFILVGTVILYISIKLLGKALTPHPKPKSHAHLVVDGMYEYARHPMYSALILISLGWSFIFVSPISLLGALLLIVLLIVKSDYEESLLIEKYGEQYRVYQAHTPKFF